MDEVSVCTHCGEMIVLTPPHGEFGTRYWVHGSNRRRPCPSNIHSSTMAEKG